MRYQFTSLLAVAFFMAAASAQSFSDIPTCAMNPALNSISATKCGTSDFKCICNNGSWLTSLLPEIEKACSADDLKKSEDIARNLCEAQGVTLSISDMTSTTGPATGTAAQATATSSSSSVSAASSTAQPTANAAAMVGYSAKQRGTEAVLGMVGVALCMAAWC